MNFIEGDRKIDYYRMSVRPTITYILIFLFAYGFIFTGSIPEDSMNDLYHLNLLTLAFWFGEKALSNLGFNACEMRRIKYGNKETKEENRKDNKCK